MQAQEQNSFNNVVSRDSQNLESSPPKQDDLARSCKPKTRTHKKQKDLVLGQLENNQAIIVEAFRLQNSGDYEECIGKLEKAASNVVEMMGKLQSSSDFYLKAMPAMKQERELIPERMTADFWSRNQMFLNHNFEKNAYLALLMRELEDSRRSEVKWSQFDQSTLEKLCTAGEPINVIISKLAHRPPKDVTARVYRWHSKT